ncbi:hypothetical protein [Cytobacillus purgationiresistens]|uniref:Uncharacterized protein n=1 Tax=Cytobacillus purgationiresistens TaxID=863449 RepID=A0ABU0AQ54_9BACI|nr:hypothetical protein [Cytobacillus purgationiresistens]MDQ0273417.1 hypothetical protein [Cytobacillus purgationiresistens]
MTINRAGTLGVNYFISYMKLIMNSFGCTVEAARDFTFLRLFQMQQDSMGVETYQQFLIAFRELKDSNS